MSQRNSQFGTHRLAALVTWSIVAWTSLAIVSNPASGLGHLFWPALALHMAYLVAMLLAMEGDWLPRRGRQIAFAAQLLLALALGWRLPIDWLPIYTIIWLATVPFFLRGRVAGYALLVGLSIAWYLIQTLSWQDPGALQQVLLFGTFHFFALLSSFETRSAREARDDVAALNRELTATQRLLEEASRQSERTRIAGDLHDLLGHHLTALTINLQIAGRLTDGEAQEKVEHCRALAKLLLSDVREAVTTLRDQQGLDFAGALGQLVDNVPGLKVELDLSQAPEINDVVTAQTLLRCVQEAITNTLRHAGAERCRVSIRAQDGHIQLDVVDDGAVSGAITPGNGLTGMRERVERLRGQLAIDTLNNGLHLHVSLPLAPAR